MLQKNNDTKVCCHKDDKVLLDDTKTNNDTNVCCHEDDDVNYDTNVCYIMKLTRYYLII